MNTALKVIPHTLQVSILVIFSLNLHNRLQYEVGEVQPAGFYAIALLPPFINVDWLAVQKVVQILVLKLALI